MTACISSAGHVRVMTTGASPISEEVFDFLRICFGATVLEGYGMTETSCVITETQPGDAAAGPAGSHIPCCLKAMRILQALTLLSRSTLSHSGSCSVSWLLPRSTLLRFET